MHNHKRYSAMKDSGVPWLGEVPEHWGVRRFKYLLRERDKRSSEGTEQLLRVSQFTGVTERKRAGEGDEPDTRSESLIGYKCVEANDLVVNIMLAWNGSMGVSSFQGIASPAYCVYRFSTPAQPWYFHHLLRSPTYKARIKAVSTGVVDSRLRLYSDALFRLEALLPPLPEQTAIVRFLDHVDRRIRRYIRSRQKLIKLLEEQKQAIIHRAVTRGLDPDVRLKPSGVEWLGDVPEHWEVRRAKAVCSAIIDCKNRTPNAIDDGHYLVVRTTCVRDGRFDAAGGYLTDEKNFRIWTARGAPQHGDVFFTREAPAGEACLVPERADLCMGQRMMYLRPNPELLDSEFLLHNIYGPLTRTYVELATNGSTVGHLRLDQVYSLPLLWCPLEEQRAIVRYIKDSTTAIGHARVTAEREISLLREYRTRLIADVVTGKLDVREAAARLPDDTEDTDSLDDFEPESIDDEAAVDSPEEGLEDTEA